MSRKSVLVRDKFVTLRISGAEEELLFALIELRQSENPGDYLRSRMFDDARLLLADSPELRKSSKAFPPPLFTPPPAQWEVLREQLHAYARATARAGMVLPPWVQNAVALPDLGLELGENAVPPAVCCVAPVASQVGVAILCGNCKAELSPIAAAQICRWKSQLAAKHKNQALADEFERQRAAFYQAYLSERENVGAQTARLKLSRQYIAAPEAAAEPVTIVRETAEVAMDDFERNRSANVALGALMQIILTECSVDGKTVSKTTVNKMGRGLMQEWLNTTSILDSYRAHGHPFHRNVTDDWFLDFIKHAFEELEKKGEISWKKAGYWKLQRPVPKKHVFGQKKSTSPTHCFNGQCDITKPNTATLPVVGSLAPFCSCDCSRCVSRRTTEQKKSVA